MAGAKYETATRGLAAQMRYVFLESLRGWQDVPEDCDGQHQFLTRDNDDLCKLTDGWL